MAAYPMPLYRKRPIPGYEDGGIVGYDTGGVAGGGYGLNYGLPPNMNGQYQSGAFNPMNSRDVYNQNQGIGQNAFAHGQAWDQTYGDLSNYYLNNEAGASQLVNNLYQPIWNGGGGYTTDQMNNILQSGGLSDIQGDESNNFLTPGEQASIAGSPYAARDLFAGQAQALGDASNAAGADIRAQAAAGAGQGTAAVGQMRSDYNAAIDPTKLSLSAGFKPGLDARLQTGQTALTAAQNNPDLTPTADYMRQAGMTDQEVQEATEAGQRGVAAQYGSLRDKLISDTTASGGGAPMQIASALGAFNRDQAAQEADAGVNAQLAARQSQRDAATGVQNTVGSMGQYRSNLQSSNALAEQNAGIAADTGAEQMRIQAQQGLTGYQTAAAQALGAAALNNAQFNTNANMGASTTAGNWGLDTSEYTAGNLANYTQNAENNAASRALALGQNRQQTNQYNQGMNYNINNTMANRYQAAYQPWLQAQTEGRQAAVGQQGYMGGQGMNAGQLRLGGAGTYGGQTQNAANSYMGWGENEANNGGVAGAIRNTGNIVKMFNLEHGGTIAGENDDTTLGDMGGGIINKNRLIEVGEHDRPEAILPLDPATPPEQQNVWERMGAKLGQHLGVPHKPKLRHPGLTIAERMGLKPAKHFQLGGIAGLIGAAIGNKIYDEPGVGNRVLDYMTDQNNKNSGQPAYGMDTASATPMPSMVSSSGSAPTLTNASASSQPTTNVNVGGGGSAPINQNMTLTPTGSTPLQQSGSGATGGGVGGGGSIMSGFSPQGPTPGGQEGNTYKRPKSVFDAGAENPFVQEMMQQAAMSAPQMERGGVTKNWTNDIGDPIDYEDDSCPGYRRGGLIGMGNKWRMRMPTGIKLPQLRLASPELKMPQMHMSSGI